MKLHLPIALFAAVMLHSTAQANGVYTVTEGDTITIGADNSINASTSETILEQLQRADYGGDTNPNAILKNGAGELIIDTNVTMNNPFVIDEGTVTIKDSTVTANRSHSNATSCLSVGGATLKMDNGHFTQTGSGVYAICLGNRDGAASVTLENGSSMSTLHYIFAGYTGSSATDYRVGIDAEPAASVAKSTINILSGSTMTAGTSLQFANVEVNIDGAGSVLADNGTNSSKNQWPESYIGYGYERDVDINVTNGGKLDFNWNVYTATGHDSNVVITVDGKDANGTASSIDVAGTMYLSMIDDYDYTTSTDTNTNATTQLQITGGAQANISQLVMGVDAGSAEVTVGSGSSYSGVNMQIGANGTLENNGTLTLKKGTTTDWLSNQDSTTQTESGILSVEGGTVTNNGTMNLETLNASQEGIITNNKLMYVTNGATLDNAKVINSGSSYISMKGDVTATNGTSFETTKGTIYFYGEVNAESGASFTTNGGKISFEKGSTLNADSDSTINVNKGTFNINGTATIEGTVNVSSGGTLKSTDSSTSKITANGATVNNNGGTIELGAIDATGSTFTATKGNIKFTKETVLTNTVVQNTESASGTGNVSFSGDVTLKGGNTFTSYSGSTQFGKSLTAEGDNTFNGGTRIQNFVVNSGTQTFDQIANTAAPTATQVISFNNIDIADDSDGKVIVKADALGTVRFSGDCEVTELYYDNPSGLEIKGSLTVTDVMELSGNMTYDSAGNELGLEAVKFIVSDIADIPVLNFLGEAENLTIVEGSVFELVFTQEAIAQIVEAEQPQDISLDLLNGTALEDTNITFNIVLENNSYDVTAVDLFGVDEIAISAGEGADITLHAAPEPTTATLSLLALAALAARRRRR